MAKDYSSYERMIDQNQKEIERAHALHQKEREVLFENEALVIKVLQAVSGASLVAGLSQSEHLEKLAGKLSLLLLLTAMTVGLLAAVIAAHWKHQYKMWQVKAAATDGDSEQLKMSKFSGLYLTGMRGAIWVALVAIAIGFIQLLVFLWVSVGHG
jgi:hypothetical protein